MLCSCSRYASVAVRSAMPCDPFLWDTSMPDGGGIARQLFTGNDSKTIRGHFQLVGKHVHYDATGITTCHQNLNVRAFGI